MPRLGIIRSTATGRAEAAGGALTWSSVILPVRLRRSYANEGICQAAVLEGDPCDTTTAYRQGKYQDQPRAW